jgi:hypothetical protein
MVRGIWFFQVAEEKQEEFLQQVNDIVKPYWESHNCIAYNVYQDMNDPTLFVKEQIYPDIESMESDGELFFGGTDPRAQEVVEIFRSYAANIEKRLCYVRIDEDGLHPKLEPK